MNKKKFMMILSTISYIASVVAYFVEKNRLKSYDNPEE